MNLDLHMSGLVGHDKGGGEAVFVVEGAAPHGVAHAGHWSVAWRQRVITD